MVTCCFVWQCTWDVETCLGEVQNMATCHPNTPGNIGNEPLRCITQNVAPWPSMATCPGTWQCTRHCNVSPQNMAMQLEHGNMPWTWWGPVNNDMPSEHGACPRTWWCTWTCWQWSCYRLIVFHLFLSPNVALKVVFFACHVGFFTPLWGNNN